MAGSIEVLRRLAKEPETNLVAVRSKAGRESRCIQRFLGAYLAEDPELVARFFDNAERDSERVHPAFVRVVGSGRRAADRRPYRLIELVSAPTLAEIVRARAPSGDWIAPQMVAALGVELLEAVEAAHRRWPDRTALRGLTPQGILIDRGRRIRILPGSMRERAFIYMSPEEVRGCALGPATDVYTVALILYELLARVHPFAPRSDQSVIESLQAVTKEQVPPLAGVPKEVARQIEQGLAKAPERRPPAAELSAALRQGSRSFLVSSR